MPTIILHPRPGVHHGKGETHPVMVNDEVKAALPYGEPIDVDDAIVEALTHTRMGFEIVERNDRTREGEQRTWRPRNDQRKLN